MLIKRKLVIGILTIITVLFIAGLIYSDSSWGFAGTIWLLFLYMTPIVLIYGTVSSIVIDYVLEKIFEFRYAWLSIVLHTLFALIFMGGLIFYESVSIEKSSYVEMLIRGFQLILLGVGAGFFYGVVNNLFKRFKWM
ncbi:hypothetical protein ACI2JA_17250 [Alkalihalobacillus sp. NPDC078783]